MQKNFDSLVGEILNEENVSGGIESAFGAGVAATSGPMSGDTYAPKDSRIPHIMGGVQRRYLPTDFITRGNGKKRKKRKAK